MQDLQDYSEVCRHKSEEEAARIAKIKSELSDYSGTNLAVKASSAQSSCNTQTLSQHSDYSCSDTLQPFQTQTVSSQPGLASITQVAPSIQPAQTTVQPTEIQPSIVSIESTDSINNTDSSEYCRYDLRNFNMYQKIYDMMVYGYKALLQFPKCQKFDLCVTIKNCMSIILERCIEGRRKYHKKNTLQDIDVELDKLKTYIRLSMELKYLSYHKYHVWSEKLEEIGRMLGGWMKSLNSHLHQYIRN